MEDWKLKHSGVPYLGDKGSFLSQ